MSSEIPYAGQGSDAKLPRKPRPSELAAKKKKAVKPKKRPVKKAKAKRSKSAVLPYARLDMRVSKADKARIVAVAKRKKWTITNVIVEAIKRVK